jgi:hypothetical protein
VGRCRGLDLAHKGTIMSWRPTSTVEGLKV